MSGSLKHRITGDPLDKEFPGSETAYFSMGCFWGAEKLFWSLPGVLSTAVGYQGGHTSNPSYEQVCGRSTGHAETVRVVHDPAVISYQTLLKVFFENHDPTQVDRQGNDVGDQYRTAIWTTTPEQAAAAEQVRDQYTKALAARGYGPVATTIAPAPRFWLAEDYHQQYLDRVPHGYCPVHATGVRCDL